MSVIYQHIHNDGMQYDVCFATVEEADKFEVCLEQYFERHGYYPNNFHRFFQACDLNPLSIDNGIEPEPAPLTMGDTMDIRNSANRKRGVFVEDLYSIPGARARQVDQTQREARKAAQARDVVAANPQGAILDVLSQTGALPTDKPLHQMSRAEQAKAAAMGLAQLVQLAAAQMATAQAEEDARGAEPPVGAAVRFSHRFGGPESKQYNYVAIRVEKVAHSPNAHREWHHSGSGDGVHNGLTNPCSWEELNDFADPDTVEVGMDWAPGPEWSTWKAPEASGDTDEDSVDQQLVTLLYAGVQEAQRILAPIAHPGAVPTKRDVKAALQSLDSSMNAHDELLAASEADEKA